MNPIQSQLCPSTTIQELSREVRRNCRTRVSPEANRIGNSIASDITELVVPSNNFNGTLGIRKGVKLCFRTKADSMKQSVEPESISALKEMFRTDSEVKGTINKLDKERIEEHNEVALILTILLALAESTQSPKSAGIEELRTNFLLEQLGFQWPLHGLSSGAFTDHMTRLATEEAETSVHATLTFLRRELAIATELVGQVVLLWHRWIGCLGRILLQCRRRVQGAAGCRTGGRRLSMLVVVWS